MLKVNWKPMAGSPTKEIDKEMEEAGNTMEGLAESKHVIKQLLEEKMEWMVKEIGLEEEVTVEEEDQEMEGDKENGRGDLFNARQDSRNALDLIKSILNNNEVVKKFKNLPNKKK